MANYANIKATIDANIRANGNEEITGPVLNSVLNAMVSTLGAGYQFVGVATPTNPGTAQTPDYKCFYLATTPGTYSYLGGLVVADGEVALLKWNTSWTKEVTGIAPADKLYQSVQDLPNLPILPKIINGEYINTDGTIKSSTSFKRTDKINVYFISEIEIVAPDGGSSYVCFLDKDLGLVSNFRVNQGTNVVSVPDGAFYLICSYSRTATDWQFNATEFNGKYKNSYAYLGHNIRLSNYEDLRITQKYGNGNSYILVDFGGGYIVFMNENGSSGWIGPLQSYTIPSNGYLYYNIKSKSVSVSQTILPLTENVLLLECHYGYAISGALLDMKYQSSQFSYEYNVRPVLRFAYYETISITRNGEASLTVNFGTGNLLYYFYGGASLKQYVSLPSTDFVVPHNQYLYYNIARNALEISDSQRFGYTDILLVNCHRGFPVQGWLTEIYENTRDSRVQTYYGQRISIGQKNNYSVERFAGLPLPTIMQGCAVSGDLLFVSGSENDVQKFFVYNLIDKTLVAKVPIGVSLHCNTMFFSDVFPNGGNIPYLYVGEWDGERKVCVFKFDNGTYTPTLIQTINFDRIDTTKIGTGELDFGIDLGNKKLFSISYFLPVATTSGNKTMICEFDLPDIEENTTKYLSNNDVLSNFECPFIWLRQQCLFDSGKLYILTSENYGYLVVVDVEYQKISNRVWLGENSLIHSLQELEGLYVYNNRLFLLSYGDPNIYKLNF